MMKKMFIAGLIVCCVLFFSGSILAQEKYKFAIGARAGFVNFADDKYTYETIAYDLKADASFILGANVTYVANKNFSLELSIDHIPDETQTDFKILGLSIGLGDLSVTPLLLTARYHFASDMAFVPYIGGGVGYLFNSFDTSALFSSAGVNFDVDNSIAFHGTIGSDIFLNKTRNVCLSIDLKYLWCNPDANLAYGGYRVDDDIDLNGFYATLGIKYFF